MKSSFLSALLGLALLTGCGEGPKNQSGSRTDAETKAPAKPDTAAPAKPEPAPAGPKEVAVMTTSEGEMVIEFWPEVAPNTVENFKKLARDGFYDGTAFHRIIKGFMIQGGDPKTKDPRLEDDYGTGDPGYKINAEFNNREHVRGVLSMARNGDPNERYGEMPRPSFANSAGSQFFICLDRAPHLDGRYTAFGKVTRGLDTLEKIGNTPVIPNAAGEPSKPVKRVVVESVKIVPADSIQ